MKHRKTVLAYVFLLPTILILTLYSYCPVFYGIYLSLHKFSVNTGKMEFSGLENYIKIFQDNQLGQSLINTLVYTVGSTVVCIVFALIVAGILNTKIKGSFTYLTIMFIPWILSDVVVGSTWSWLFNPDVGVLNYLFKPFGLKPSVLLNDPRYAMIGVIVAALWKLLAYYTVLLLAGMQNLSKDYIEAARLDGCTSLQTIRYITLPIMAPTIITVTLLSVINGISQSGRILVLTNGGPVKSTQTLALLLYKEAFENFNFNGAAAMSMVLAVINIAVVFVYLKLTAKKTVEV